MIVFKQEGSETIIFRIVINILEHMLATKICIIYKVLQSGKDFYFAALNCFYHQIIIAHQYNLLKFFFIGSKFSKELPKGGSFFKVRDKFCQLGKMCQEEKPNETKIISERWLNIWLTKSLIN